MEKELGTIILYKDSILYAKWHIPVRECWEVIYRMVNARNDMGVNRLELHSLRNPVARFIYLDTTLQWYELIDVEEMESLPDRPLSVLVESDGREK